MGTQAPLSSFHDVKEQELGELWVMRAEDARVGLMDMGDHEEGPGPPCPVSLAWGEDASSFIMPQSPRVLPPRGPFRPSLTVRKGMVQRCPTGLSLLR